MLYCCRTKTAADRTIQHQAMETPVHRLPRMSQDLKIDLRVKRDDLLPFPGGGNKSRIIQGWIAKASTHGFNALVTSGGLGSNLVRTVALECAKRSWSCAAALHGTAEAAFGNPNVRALRLLGAEIQVVPPDNIGPTLERLMVALREKGRNPLLIPGGGYGVEGSLGYFNASQKQIQDLRSHGWEPDFIVHASGTGTTQAGIVAGVGSIGSKARVLGISVARPSQRGANLIRELVCKLLKKMAGPPPIIEFTDRWTLGGYEKQHARLWEAIECFGKQDGLLLDPTYTGKAALALLDLVREGEIPRGSRVLFWHTGGLLNLWSSECVG